MESFLPELSEGALGKSKVGGHLLAELQYTFWWDGSGMKFEMGGMDPTCHYPKLRPTYPRDFLDTSFTSVPKRNFGYSG